MRLGLYLPMFDRDGALLDGPAIVEVARLIESSGFESIWSWDGSYTRALARGTEIAPSCPDPLMRLALAAAGTSEVEVGTAVYQIPLRHPVELAQRFMTLAALSHNRFTAGVGSGSTEEGSFATIGIPFADRFKLLNSHTDVLRRLLRGEAVGPALVPPLPEARGGPHLVLGAWTSETTLRRAATEYDGWMSSAGRVLAQGIDTAKKGRLSTMRENIARYRDQGGNRAMVVSCALNLEGPNRPLGDDEGFNLVCGPAEARIRLGRLADLGFDDICCFYADRAGAALRDLDTELLGEIRSLVAPDGRRPYPDMGVGV